LVAIVAPPRNWVGDGDRASNVLHHLASRATARWALGLAPNRRRKRDAKWN
jgi:hypothetical protein